MRPRVVVRAAIAVVCVLAVGMLPLRAQSLADVARAEAARRQAITRPAKVYTNKDLVSVPPPSSSAPAPPPPDAANTSTSKPPSASTDEKAEADDTSSATPAAEDKPKDQAYWSGRQKALQVQLDRDQILIDALQSRINGLTADFSARDDPAQRAVIAIDRQKALDELDRLNRTVVSDRKAIGDFQEEARRASVPPGWLR